MPYYMIEKQPVFLPTFRYELLENEVAKDKDATLKVSSKFVGKEHEEKSKLMYELLYKKYVVDPKGFYNKWVCFDIKGKEASKNIWDLLYDYCHLYGYARLSDIRDEVERLLYNYVGDTLTYPMGEVFALDHFVKPRWHWWHVFSKPPFRKLRVVIDVLSVHRLKGELKNFTIYAKGFQLICNHDVLMHSLKPIGDLEG